MKHVDARVLIEELGFAVLVADAFYEQIKFFTTLILNADEFEA